MKFPLPTRLNWRPVPPIPFPRAYCVRAFSLVEVVMALGIVAFSMLAILGALPMGLATLQESVNQTAVAVIAQQIRGELQQISFDSKSDSFNITNLGSEYYTYEGVKTDETNANRYYTATFVTSDPNAGGASFAPADGGISNAKNVTVSLTYPGSGNRPIVFSLFAAKQTSSAN